MPFIIPNATDTTGSNRYNALDQAEPDALDFQILGNRSTGVISGCAVTAQTVANYTVAVSGGYVALNGVVYEVPSNPALALHTVPSNYRFDLVVARLIAGSINVVIVYGPDSATNPTFPPTPSRMTTTVGVSTSTYINPDTDVVLATIYRSGAANVTNAHIVDKRVSVPSTTSLRGDIVPPSGLGTDGDLYYKSAVSGSAGLYVKVNGTWLQIGTGSSSAGSGVPIGTVITWAVSSATPDVSAWLECNGQSVSRTSYSNLFSVIGTTYGNVDSNTFNVPDYRGHILMGLSSGRSVATPYGNAGNSITLTVSQMPEHNHSGSPLGTTQVGDHNHSADGNPVGIILRSSSAPTSTGSLRVHSPYTGSSGTTLGIGTTNSRGAHQHSITGSTGSTGSGTAVSIEPRNYQVKYYIKYA